MGKKKSKQEEKYVLSPKGIACIAIRECGLISSVDDSRLDDFWSRFEETMRALGYVGE